MITLIYLTSCRLKKWIRHFHFILILVTNKFHLLNNVFKMFYLNVHYYFLNRPNIRTSALLSCKTYTINITATICRPSSKN